jgi:hypothetical protein
MEVTMRELDSSTVESSELVEQTFKFWFSDNGHIRSPFPEYIREELKPLSTKRFYEWVTGLNPEAKDELNDEAVGEKFEEIIFETANDLIKTDDERITILYPFLPRLGDSLKDDSDQESTIKERELTKDGDSNFLKVYCETNNTKDKWTTTFQLPI